MDPNDRLPIPPPERHDEEPRPRPANLELSLSQLDKGMQLEVLNDDDELCPGSIITSHTPHPLRERTGTPSRSVEPILRLVRPLGQGAFSAAWLAEDLSPLPLALASKDSVRDLRRKASLKSGKRHEQAWRRRDTSIRPKALDLVRQRSRFGSRVYAP